MEHRNLHLGGAQEALTVRRQSAVPNLTTLTAWPAEFGLGRLPGHPDQPELDLQWPGIPKVEDVGRVPQADIQTTGRFLVAVVETLDGRRPLAQLEQRLHPRVYAAMQTRVRHNPRPGQTTQLRSLHTYQPTAGVIEACATIEGTQRAQALAARLQRRKPGWLCTVLRVL